MTTRQTFKEQAKVLRTLARESRLMIVERLSRGECSVGELTELVGRDVSTVSKHLALLRAYGIVGDRRDSRVLPAPDAKCMQLFDLRYAGNKGEIKVSIEIKVLGPGCANCNRLYAEAEKAVAQVSAPAKLTKVEDIKDIMAYRILATPALVINGELKSAGRIPSAAEITTWLATAVKQ